MEASLASTPPTVIRSRASGAHCELPDCLPATLYFGIAKE